jgi:hypothetical protein
MAQYAVQEVQGVRHGSNAGLVKTVLRVPSGVFEGSPRVQDQPSQADADWFIEEDYCPRFPREDSRVRIRRGFSDELFEVPALGGVVQGRDLGSVPGLDRKALLRFLNRVLRFHAAEMYDLRTTDPAAFQRRNLPERRVVLRWIRSLEAANILRRIRQQMAARSIQRLFRMAQANPAFRMCQKRLQREFEDLGVVHAA